MALPVEEIGCCVLPVIYALQPDGVHVWRISLDWSPVQVQAFYDVLSPDEQKKADRFHFAADRLRYVTGRGVLRTMLARCTGLDAAHLSFEYGAFGKPSLAPGSINMPLQFNVSHSGELVLIALTLGRVVGVDVEAVRDNLDMDRIAASFFSPHEQKALRSLPEHSRSGAFFDCWARKEAFIKAIGGGLSIPLQQFDVCLSPEPETGLLATRPDPNEALRWDIRALPIDPRYRAAVAIEGKGGQLTMFDWSGMASG
jgi:4'-phosphopantetheinyl transferase